MKVRKTTKCAKGKKIIRKLVFVGILVAIAGCLTRSEKEKADYLARRKERHKEWASNKMLFSDEERDLW